MTETILDYYGFFEPARLAELDLQPLASLNWSGPNPLFPEEAVQSLGLSLYKAKTRGRTDILLGSTDETLHPHDRWLYMWQWSDGQGWYRIDNHPGVLFYLNQENFNATMRGLEARLRTSKAEYNGAWNASCELQAFHHKYDMTAPLQPILAKGSITPVDLHDLSFHYSRWLARNPEYTDMPRELVWRMHGLGEAAARAAMHREWGTAQMGNDRSFLREDE